jgi:hypothetical protein
VGVVTRSSDEPFTASAANDLLNCLHFFLSFARGFRCGPFVVEGLGKRGRPVWTQWSSHLLATDWRGVSSWFPVQDAGVASTAFTGFRDLWCEAVWQNPLRHMIHWYVAANTSTAAIEGSLILAHTALEELAWVHLVVRGKQPPNPFDKKRSGQRIAALLSSLSIDPSLPSSRVPDLAAWGIARGIDTGPWAISEVRNRLVHPKGRADLMRASPRVRIQATNLALWYIEVSLLALCRYSGQYVDRLHAGPTIFEATSPVPWMTSPTPTGTKAPPT